MAKKPSKEELEAEVNKVQAEEADKRNKSKAKAKVKKEKLDKATKEFKAKKKKEELKKKVADGEVNEVEPEILPAEVKQTTTALAAPLDVCPEVLEHCMEALETLETLEDDIKLPIIRLTADGFEMSKGAEPVLEFTGIIIHNKRSNVYYEGKYRPGDNKPPRCLSINGRVPDSDFELQEGQEPIHANCKECPKNQWKSDPTGGEGKACKNTRPLFILVDNPESETIPVIPKVLRIPPTSLAAINEYIVSACTDFGSLYGIRTKLTCYKKDEQQPYYNIKFINMGGKFLPQEKTNVKYVRGQWMNYMTNGMFGIDVETMEVEKNEKVVSAQGEQGDIEY